MGQGQSFTIQMDIRPVTAYGYILLGELVAIRMSVMEHLITNSTQIQHVEIRIFSDSSGNNYSVIRYSML